MKYLLFTLTLLSIVSCSDVEELCYEDSDCTGECIFYENDLIVNVTYVPCFDSWGFRYKGGDSLTVFALYPQMLESNRVEGAPMTISALFFENNLPLVIPDPMPGRFYKVETCGIAAQ